MIRSLDINCTASIWQTLERVVFNEGRQLGTVDDLRDGLIYEWKMLSFDDDLNVVLLVQRRF